jgi:hypothetical protein
VPKCHLAYLDSRACCRQIMASCWSMAIQTYLLNMEEYDNSTPNLKHESLEKSFREIVPNRISSLYFSNRQAVWT